MALVTHNTKHRREVDFRVPGLEAMLHRGLDQRCVSARPTLSRNRSESRRKCADATITGMAGSHVSMVSNPGATIDAILAAAAAVSD